MPVKTRPFFIILILLLSACSPEFRRLATDNRVKYHAPEAPEQTGHIVHNVSNEELSEFLKKHPEAKIRPLYPKQGMYEVFTDHPEDLPKSVENTFIINPQTVPDQDPEKFLENCDLYAGKGPYEVEITGVRKLNQMLTIKASATSDTKLEYYIQFHAPRGSLLKKMELLNSQMNFTPDQIGIYNLTLVAKEISDSEEPACWMQKHNVEVVENPEYDPSLRANAEFIKNLDMSSFWHLQNLNWNFSEAQVQGDNVIVAVIDSGVNYNHPAIAGSLITNSKEIPGNMIDDDNNGFTDDIYGFDFIDQDAQPFDRVGHGSHVAALIASPVMGVARKAQLLPIRAMTSFGYDVGTLSAAIYYAVDNGADIINFSIGWFGNPDDAAFEPLKKAIAYAEEHSVLIVCASGNGNAFRVGLDIDQKKFIPASFENSNIIVVAALDKANQLTVYSNVGKVSVDIAAPGGSKNDGEILSADMKTANGNLWHLLSGTSQATPLVSGALALLKSLQPTATSDELRELLYQKATLQDSALEPYISEARRLDLTLLSQP